MSDVCMTGNAAHDACVLVMNLALNNAMPEILIVARRWNGAS